MSISYYSYYLRDKEDDSKYAMDLLWLFSQIVEKDDAEFKNSFKHDDELMCLALTSEVKGAFLFALTKDKEIVSLINRRKPGIINGLETKLQSDDEMIAFSSYIYLGKKNCIAIAGKTYSPRFALIGEYINHYLSKLGFHERYDFVLEPLVKEASKEELLRFNYIGKTTIRINTKASSLRHAFNFVTANEINSNLQYIEISFTPIKGKSIKDDMAKVIKTLDDDLQRIIAKVKDEISGKMQDIYVLVKGGIRDKLTLSKNTHENFKSMESLVSQNMVLSQKIDECLNQNDVQDFLPSEIKEKLSARYHCSI